MVFVFGVDLPLVELIFTFSIIAFILLVEVTVVMVILLYQLRRSKEISRILLLLEDAELRTLDKISKRKKKNY